MDWFILDTTQDSDLNAGVHWCGTLQWALTLAASRANTYGRPQEVYLDQSYGHARLVAIQVPQG